MPYPQIHRLVVIGGERVGKTAIIEQLIFGNHVIGQGGLPTVGDIYDIVLETEKGTHERIQIFDTPGWLFDSSAHADQQEHHLLLADGFVLVYEITSKSSFELAAAVRQKIASKNKEVPLVLLGNKCDCNAIRQVSSASVGAWARSNGIKPYEVSVMNRDCLKEPFCYIAWRMANPGRGFSALPLLTSAAASSSKSLPVPGTHQADHAPFFRDMAQGLGKLQESQRDGRGGSSSQGSLAEQSTDGCPEDALFPPKRGGAATLFLGDCLGANKPKQDPPPSNH